MQENELAI